MAERVGGWTVPVDERRRKLFDGMYLSRGLLIALCMEMARTMHELPKSDCPLELIAAYERSLMRARKLLRDARKECEKNG